MVAIGLQHFKKVTTTKLEGDGPMGAKAINSFVG